MSATYLYVPGEKTVKSIKEETGATFAFAIKENGYPLTVPKFTYDDDELNFRCDSYSYAACYLQNLVNGKKKVAIQIPLVSNVTVPVPTSMSESVTAMKDKLIMAVKALADTIKPIPKVDLETGQVVPNKITIDFGFQQGVVTERVVETVGAAEVLFDCRSIAQGKQVQGVCKAGKIVFPSTMPHQNDCWHLDRLGWNTVPSVIKWSEEEIKEAFRDLARQILAEPEIPDAQIWKVKEVVQICLE